MSLTLPIDVLFILKTLAEAGYSAYIVGGAVRDILMDSSLEPTDWDFTTNATPEQIQKLFSDSFYENDFGTVAVAREHIHEQFGLHSSHISQKQAKHSNSKVIDLQTATKLHESLQQKSEVADESHPQKHVFEITTFRSEGVYSDFRRPDQITWGESIAEDLQRRDFTINAMAIEVPFNEQFPELNKNFHEIELRNDTFKLIDPFQGKSDLDQKLIRTVGSANDRIKEDALRMLRAIRFSVQLDFSLDDELMQALSKHAELIKHISKERIRDEFLKMLASPSPKTAIELLDSSGILKYILPELLDMKGIQQGGHHISDVWTHSLDAVEHCPSTDPIVRFATLLHDIAKPQTYQNADGKITFYNHEIIGARIARNIAERFALSKTDIQRIFTLVRHHMFYYQPQNTDASIRRFMRKVGLENINDIIDVRIGDRLGSGARETSWRFEEMKKRMQEQLHQPFSVSDLAIDGNDLINELNLQPGPTIGKILSALFETVLENPEFNDKQKLLTKASELLTDID